MHNNHSIRYSISSPEQKPKIVSARSQRTASVCEIGFENVAFSKPLSNSITEEMLFFKRIGLLFLCTLFPSIVLCSCRNYTQYESSVTSNDFGKLIVL